VTFVAGFATLIRLGPEPGGIEDMWTALFGPADAGAVDFATLRRRRAPSDALACPPDACPFAEPDIVPPVFPVEGARLRAIVAEAARADPDTELVFAERWAEHDRYVARSKVLRFPDTINAEIIGQGEGRSTLALYSRSRIGLYDFGVNRARLRRWLDRIGAAAERG
jgi:uncharacterized protein (DUF1499 family)